MALMQFLRLSLAAFAFAITAHAQAPAATTLPPPPKKIPALGISLTDVDRAELTAGAIALRTEIDALTRDLASEPRLLALLPDVEIFEKAVAWSLDDDTFFSTKEIAFAKKLLAEGRERAAQLRAKKSPWLDARGLIVRGHRSKLDGSVQPYGLVVPAELDLSQPTPALVWLLGRGEKRTELAFLAEREAGPPQLTPKGVLTVIPYGRFCNATKFAGEVDVMEALAAVRAQYSIDPLRIAVAGFSMGGGSTWHLATHFPGLWCAASPGAGFAETPIFSKALAPGKEPRTAWEQILWRQYEATGIAGNLFNVPTLAYAGEIDPQKEASDLMEAAMAKEGLKLERFIGPQTVHKYHDVTKVELTKRLEELIATGRPATPREIRFSTYTLRYAESAWVKILSLEKHWERADVHAMLADDHTLTVTTKNVTALSFSDIKPTAILLDGQRLTPTAGLTFTRSNNQWSASDPSTFTLQPSTASAAASAAPRKHPGLTGPIDDAFMEPFVFVRPTGKPLNAELGTWVESELTAARHLWRDVFRGDTPVIADTALTDADIANKNLILWGDPSSNHVLKKLLATGKLPLTWDAKSLTFGGNTYDTAHHAPILIFPNPLNPQHYVVLNSGIDFRSEAFGSNAHQNPKLPDWAVVDLRTAPGPRWPGKIVYAGFFNEEWK
jgi:dienelactone hydrolase